MRYRYTLQYNHITNKKYIRDEDSMNVDSSVSYKAKAYEEIDADLVDLLNKQNNIIEKQEREIYRLQSIIGQLQAQLKAEDVAIGIKNFISGLL